ncbi:MAG TPA: hypothetical protein VI029_12510, partial [Mycobacterium sp.]
LAARAMVLHDSQLPKDELDSKLLAGPGSGSFFGHQPVTNYYATALKVRSDLEALRDAVRRVDAEGWPARFSDPQTGA